MPDKCKLLENIKIFLLALSLTVPAILVSRVISPRATIDSSYIFWPGYRSASCLPFYSYLAAAASRRWQAE